MSKSKNNAVKGSQTEFRAAVARSATQGQTVVTHQTSHVSTIFDPEVLKKFAELVPDAPERVLAVFENNAAMEIKLHQASISHQESVAALQAEAMRHMAADNKRRDWMAFGIIAGCLTLSGVFAAFNQPWLSGATLLGVIGYVVSGYLQKHKKTD